MAKADSVYITPPEPTSAFDYPMMFPLRDPTRRRFLAVAAVASVVSVGTLAAATAMDPSVPRAVTMPRHSGPDPIYDVIKAHRKAALEHSEAERVQFAFDAGGKTGERREEYDRLVALDNMAWAALTEAGSTLVNTRPTTLAGILALCKYIEPLFGAVDHLPDYIDYEDDAQAYIPEAFAYVIGRAIEELMKAGQT
jgi:hypothetical protein